jgi:Rieske Fe-S protein
MNRREFIRGVVVTSTLVAVGAVSIVELLARAGSGDQTYQLPTTTTQSQSGTQSSSRTQTQQQVSAPPGYILIGPLSALNGRTSAYFTHPTYGDSILVNVNGTWRAFSSTCTHAPCTVQYDSGSPIYCPCHGATFSTNDGSVLSGPAPVALPEYGVQILEGNLYVTASTIN